MDQNMDLLTPSHPGLARKLKLEFFKGIAVLRDHEAFFEFFYEVIEFH